MSSSDLILLGVLGALLAGAAWTASGVISA
jgi:hypothetical protein